MRSCAKTAGTLSRVTAGSGPSTDRTEARCSHSRTVATRARAVIRSTRVRRTISFGHSSDSSNTSPRDEIQHRRHLAGDADHPRALGPCDPKENRRRLESPGTARVITYEPRIVCIGMARTSRPYLPERDLPLPPSLRNWTAMRLLMRILYPLRRNRIAVLGARSAPKRYCQTSQRLCRNIKGRALGWLLEGRIAFHDGHWDRYRARLR